MYISSDLQATMYINKVKILLGVDDKTDEKIRDLRDFYEDLKDLLGCEVDLITDGGLMPFARESADHDKILIYERAA